MQRRPGWLMQPAFWPTDAPSIPIEMGRPLSSWAMTRSISRPSAAMPRSRRCCGSRKLCAASASCDDDSAKHVETAHITAPPALRSHHTA
eukprot:scaffold8336_cov63-Phaeocystis_antarctica.AAC.3